MKIVGWPYMYSPGKKPEPKILPIHDLAMNALVWAAEEKLPFNAVECWREWLDDTLWLRFHDNRLAPMGKGPEWARAWDTDFEGSMQSCITILPASTLKESIDFIKTVLLPRHLEALKDAIEPT